MAPKSDIGELTIPCCLSCNNGALQPIETALSKAVLKGPEAVKALGGHMLFVWLGKIFYGLLYRELFLSINRSNPSEGTITDPELLEMFNLHHLFLQSVRLPMEFVSAFPASILVYETKVPAEPAHQWDLRDNLGMFIAVRAGSVGIVALLQDGGAHTSLWDALKSDYIGGPLHPVQHIELSARVAYMASRMNRVPKFIVTEGATIQVLQAPLAGFSGRPLFDDWQEDEYAKFLAAFLDVDLEVVFDLEKGAMTWLLKPDGSTKDLSFDALAWPMPL